MKRFTSPILEPTKCEPGGSSVTPRESPNVAATRLAAATGTRTPDPIARTENWLKLLRKRFGDINLEK